jgi:hypothetical protein
MVNVVLVLVGWISFVSAFLVEGLLANLVLQTVARVLPSTRDPRFSCVGHSS